MTLAVRGGAQIRMGVDHPRYQATVDAVPAAVRDSLAKDLAG
jgi:hypothetical protein